MVSLLFLEIKCYRLEIFSPDLTPGKMHHCTYFMKLSMKNISHDDEVDQSMRKVSDLTFFHPHAAYIPWTRLVKIIGFTFFAMTLTRNFQAIGKAIRVSVGVCFCGVQIICRLYV